MVLAALHRQLVRVVLRAASEGGEREVATGWPAADGRFALCTEGHAPVALELTLRGQPQPLRRVEGLTVADDEVLREERLQALDLRGRVRTLALDVVDAHGRAVSDVQALVDGWDEAEPAPERLRSFTGRLPCPRGGGASACGSGPPVARRRASRCTPARPPPSYCRRRRACRCGCRLAGCRRVRR